MTEWLWPVLITFGAALLPGLELRAGIPAGVALGLSAPVATAVAIAGNILQILVALYVAERAYRWSARFPRIRRWLEATEVQVNRHRGWILRYGWLGLALFVVLPLPGTGAFGGVVVARLLQVSRLGVWIGLCLGIALSGVLMGAGVHGAMRLFGLDLGGH